MADDHNEKDMLRQLQEINERMNRFEKQHKDKLGKMVREHRLDIDEIEKNGKKTMQALTQTIEDRKELISRLERENQLLREENARMQSNLKQRW